MAMLSFSSFDPKNWKGRTDVMVSILKAGVTVDAAYTTLDKLKPFIVGTSQLTNLHKTEIEALDADDAEVEYSGEEEVCKIVGAVIHSENEPIIYMDFETCHVRRLRKGDTLRLMWSNGSDRIAR